LGSSTASPRGAVESSPLTPARGEAARGQPPLVNRSDGFGPGNPRQSHSPTWLTATDHLPIVRASSVERACYVVVAAQVIGSYTPYSGREVIVRWNRLQDPNGHLRDPAAGCTHWLQACDGSAGGRKGAKRQTRNPHPPSHGKRVSLSRPARCLRPSVLELNARTRRYR